jgi:hypothetical protein
MKAFFVLMASAALLIPAIANAAPVGLTATNGDMTVKAPPPPPPPKARVDWTTSGKARTASGSSKGINWVAEKNLVGVTSTGTIASGGDPIYLPSRPERNSVVALIMDYGADGSFICSGSLLSDRASILTAGHCVSSGAGTAGPLAVTAYFYDGPNGDATLTSVGTAVPISQIFVHPGYTGEVIDQNDIAVLRLSVEAPAFAQGYNINQSGALEGKNFTVAGVGGRSTVGGNLGVNAGTGRLREGDNRYDFTLGDADFFGFFTDIDANGENFFGTAQIEHSIISDFDNGLVANDASCILGVAAFGGNPGRFCDLGRGAREVGVAGGDSGGPQFFKGKVSSVTSYGLSFGADFGDAVAGLQSSFGEYSGYVPTSIHTAFIRDSMVPEPGSWMMMIAGFGLAGTAMRRQRKAFASS